MKIFYVIIFILVGAGHSVTAQSSKSYKFCISTYTNRYEIKFVQDDGQNATFNLYDRSGNLVKRTTGNWELRDEGVYGPALFIIYKFSGLNTDLPNMKFLYIRDGQGSPQEIRDTQDRTWKLCF